MGDWSDEHRELAVWAADFIGGGLDHRNLSSVFIRGIEARFAALEEENAEARADYTALQLRMGMVGVDAAEDARAECIKQLNAEAADLLDCYEETKQERDRLREAIVRDVKRQRRVLWNRCLDCEQDCTPDAGCYVAGEPELAQALAGGEGE